MLPERLSRQQAAVIGNSAGGIERIRGVPRWLSLLCSQTSSIRNVKETINRADQFKEMAKKSGVTVKDMYWTLGRHDIVVVCEAPDDETATALLLSVSSRGFVRSGTLRAFSFTDIKKVLDKPRNTAPPAASRSP